ncbi:hypothetical protein V1506DRAFT_195844 [Lipomyces tetrasporus]
MPIRQRSCDTCFRGKRKCGLEYPACKRCQKNNRTCHYRYPSPPQTMESSSFGVASNPVDAPASGPASVDLDFWSDTAFEIDLNDSMLVRELMYPSVPDMLGQLGDLQPVSGNTQSWKWVIEQLKSYPRAFAQHAETVFIRKDLVCDSFPQAIRAAFGVCAACLCMDEDNESVLFRSLNAEVSDLLKKPTSCGALLEDLTKLQAVVLYQIIRIFHGDIKQRALAEQQQSYLGAWGLQLLRRADVELRDAQPSWQTWILTESIRRTVIVAFMIYAVYSIFKHGVCPELPTLSILPISTKQAFWNSRATYLQHSYEDETVKYGDFTTVWLSSPPRKLEPFEKMILVACKGLERVEALSCPDSTE